MPRPDFDTPNPDGDLWGQVRGCLPLSLCDWPGRTTAVLFLGGCNLRCPTCHNAGLAFQPGSLPPVDRVQVLADLRRNRGWLDGLVVTGGEPTIHAGRGLEGWLRELRAELGLPIKIDTNGLRPEVSARLLAAGLVDRLAVDVKGPPALYPALTGGAVSAARAAACLDAHFDLARHHPGQAYFRCTRVPLLTAEDLAEVARLVPAGAELRWQDYVPPAARLPATLPAAVRPSPPPAVVHLPPPAVRLPALAC